MPKGFVVNAHRIDPYKNFKFQLVWDGRVVLVPYVAGRSTTRLIEEARVRVT